MMDLWVSLTLPLALSVCISHLTYFLCSTEEGGGYSSATLQERMSIQDEAALLHEVGDVLRKLRERREVREMGRASSSYGWA